MLSARHRRAIRLSLQFIAPYRWQALGALLALIVTAGITLSMGQGIRLLVDQGFMTQSPQPEHWPVPAAGGGAGDGYLHPLLPGVVDW